MALLSAKLKQSMFNRIASSRGMMQQFGDCIFICEKLLLA
jgi:hypothetical protein